MIKKAVIICGGRTNCHFANEYISQKEPDLLIAADSGLEIFDAIARVPNIIIGDFDSVKEEVLKKYLSVGEIKLIRLNQEKDETDTEAAIYEAVNEGCTNIDLLGATGTRIDHLLGNIHLLGISLEEDVQIRIVDPNNRVQMVDRPLHISRKEQHGKYISLIPFTGEVRGVTLTGMRYPLEDARLECYHSLGISNEIVEEDAFISFESGVLLVIESKD